ncbi:Glycine/D-amino acid oxidase [Chitinophaga costaii]|uniref:Glycine/D-amino acid oxidase n=1 Tax=Chitinophaga costaii TaxID=1335309 RepID=A0A1C4F5A8_9BACT|nr:FAD-dependent oxidoreductase [Chitinophaga costaii]SCC50843.1 Glycine/D-amino acid oxidase [Chitinophaga costaii]
MKDYLLIGQGIAGTLLSWHLLQAQKDILVIDEARPDTASRIAAGIINPVSGRRFETAWEYDRIYPFAKDTYAAMAALLHTDTFVERDIFTVFPSAQMQAAFHAKTNTSPYIQPVVENRYAHYLQQEHGAAIVKGATVLLQNLLPAYRRYLAQLGCLQEAVFDFAALELHDNHVSYKGLAAKRIIFCEGPAIARNPFFNFIPFLPNKGEALHIKIPGFFTESILKKSIMLVPQAPEHFWLGSTFAWDFPDTAPTAAKRAELENGLQQLLSVPYTVTGHKAAIRPSTTDRRPVAGLHPQYPQLGVWNGLGTKGCSLAPLMAWHFSQLLENDIPLPPEIEIKRFFNRWKA